MNEKLSLDVELPAEYSESQHALNSSIPPSDSLSKPCRGGIRNGYPTQALAEKTVDVISAIQVPHSWFIHFYLVSVTSSVFWGIQILTQGSLLKALGGTVETSSVRSTMSVDQVMLVWTLMGIQGIRRLLESFTSTKSTSKMFFAHWVLGIVFYLAMGVATWIEGIGM